MRAARLILVAVATCAIAAALGTIAFAAASHDEPGLGPAVQVSPGTSRGAAAKNHGPHAKKTDSAGPEESGTTHKSGQAHGTQGSHGSGSTGTHPHADGDDAGATRATTSPRHAGDDDDEGDGDDDHDEDGEGD